MSSQGTQARGEPDDLVRRGVVALVPRTGQSEMLRRQSRRIRALEKTVEGLESRLKSLEKRFIDANVPESR